MSDYTEYAEYYKKAWEKALSTHTTEAEWRGFKKTVETLDRNGFGEAVDFLLQNSWQIIEGDGA